MTSVNFNKWSQKEVMPHSIWKQTAWSDSQMSQLKENTKMVWNFLIINATSRCLAAFLYRRQPTFFRSVITDTFCSSMSWYLCLLCNVLRAIWYDGPNGSLFLFSDNSQFRILNSEFWINLIDAFIYYIIHLCKTPDRVSTPYPPEDCT